MSDNTTLTTYAALARALLCAVVSSSCSGVEDQDEFDTQPGDAETQRIQAPVRSDDEDWLPIPGWGLLHRACVHEVPNGALVNASSGEVTVNGRHVGRHRRCTHGVKRVEEGYPGYTHWIEWSSAPAPYNYWGGHWFNKIRGEWTVPPAPTSTGALVYLFNGLQDAMPGTGHATVLLQPVLRQSTHGSSWDVTSCACVKRSDIVNCYRTPGWPVNIAQRLEGVVEAFDCDISGLCDVWYVDLYGNDELLQGLGLIGWEFPKLDVVNKAVLEEWYLTDCAQLPAGPRRVDFEDTHLYMPGRYGPNHKASITIRNWTNVIDDEGKPECDYAVTTLSPESVRLRW